MFEGIDGAGVFFGVGEAAVPEDAGYGLDVGSIAQQVRSLKFLIAGAVYGGGNYTEMAEGDRILFRLLLL